MAEFFDHPQTGVLHFRAMAGGYGGGATSFYEAPATPSDIKAYPQDHARYVVAKNKAAAEAMKSEKVAEEIVAIQSTATSLADDTKS